MTVNLFAQPAKPIRRTSRAVPAGHPLFMADSAPKDYAYTRAEIIDLCVLVAVCLAAGFGLAYEIGAWL